MLNKLSVRALDLKGKRVLIRVDFNVPMEEGKITDDARIVASIPTIRYVIEQGGIPILMSHLGRPKGEEDQAFSLQPVAKRLEELLKTPVIFSKECCGQKTKELVAKTKPGSTILLENLRFHKGEEKPDEEPGFAAALAELGNCYVDDAFGAIHRSHASITELPKLFPGLSAAGLLLEKEIHYLSEIILKNAKRPLAAILGGSKISTKFKVIQVLMQKADLLLIGGAMAFNFLKADGMQIGDSLVEESYLPIAKELLNVDEQSACKLVLPVDIVITKNLKDKGPVRSVSVQEGIPKGWMGVDIGPKTVELFQTELQKAKTIFWNGPMGVFETPPFDSGTNALAKTVASLNATRIAGGGDSLAAIKQALLQDAFDHLSTGGGAMLEFIEYGSLPGIDALSNKT